MSKPKSKKILELFFDLAEKMDVKIVNAKGDFQGGLCSVNDKKHIVINTVKPIDQQINILAEGFLKLNVDGVFLAPILREYLDNKEKRLF